MVARRTALYDMIGCEILSRPQSKVILRTHLGHGRRTGHDLLFSCNFCRLSQLLADFFQELFGGLDSFGLAQFAPFVFHTDPAMIVGC